MLQIKNVSYSYTRRRNLISDFSLTIEPGTVCGLLGKNGVGKSTLIYLITGLLRPDSGEIDYDGFTPISRKTAFLQDVFLVSEEFTLPSIGLSKFVEVNSCFYPKFDGARMRHYLEMMELDYDINLGQLSMGQRKKAFLCFAMACNTSLLLMDEPTNGLDISSKRNFSKALAECMTEDKTVIISTHQVHDLDRILDHVVIMDNDSVLLNASLADLSQRYSFSFTTDSERARTALAAVEVPGGYNIVEPLSDPDLETEVNLETLFELVTRQNMNN